MIDLFSWAEEEKKNKNEEETAQEENIKEKNEELDTKEESDKIFSVFELTRKIKLLLENSLDNFWVEGEISNHKKHTSGHHYFSIKDEKSVINCVMWRGVATRIPVKFDNGIKVKIFGRVTVYEAGGKYQVEVINAQYSGLGDLNLQFELLKRKLDAEGLFDRYHKKPIPQFVRKIGVVTAETGAAFQDIKRVISRRAPFTDIYLYNSKVQGEGAYLQIVNGIEVLNKHLPDLDVIIIGRGGGSLEDLWCFNEEAVARAVFKSKIPIISAVGHEIDFAISDFVADLRAATPSHAAELATIDKKEEFENLEHLKSRLGSAIKNYFRHQNQIIERAETSYAFKRPVEIIKNYMMTVDNLEYKFYGLLGGILEYKKGEVKSIEGLLRSLGPQSVLKRGYAIIQKDNKPITQASKVVENDIIQIKMQDGDFDAQVK